MKLHNNISFFAYLYRYLKIICVKYVKCQINDVILLSADISNVQVYLSCNRIMPFYAYANAINYS